MQGRNTLLAPLNLDCTVVALQGNPVSPGEPDVGDVMVWDGDNWTPGASPAIFNVVSADRVNAQTFGVIPPWSLESSVTSMYMDSNGMIHVGDPGNYFSLTLHSGSAFIFSNTLQIPVGAAYTSPGLTGNGIGLMSIDSNGDVYVSSNDPWNVNDTYLYAGSGNAQTNKSFYVTNGITAGGAADMGAGSVNVTDNYYINGVPIGGSSGPITGPIIGITDGSNAAPGDVGEFISSTTILNNNTPISGYGAGAVVPSATITLTPGDWQIDGNIGAALPYVASDPTQAIVPNGYWGAMIAVGGTMRNESVQWFPFCYTTSSIYNRMSAGSVRANVTVNTDVSICIHAANLPTGGTPIPTTAAVTAALVYIAARRMR
jgi:hypothetical protein